MHADGFIPPSVNEDSKIARLLDEFTDQLNAGQQPDLEAFLAQHSELAEALRPVLETLQSVFDISQSGDMPLGPSDRSEPSGTEKRLGDFRILNELGRGGMGIVYEAEQISMGGRKVALKVLPFAAMADEKRLQRFRNEIRAAASLDHPNIVSVYSVGEERGVHFYAMQLIRGQSLAVLIEQLRDLRQQQHSLSAGSMSAVLSASVSKGSGHFCESGSVVYKHDAQASESEPDLHSLASRACWTPSSDTIPEVRGLVSTNGIPRRSEFFQSVAELGIQAAEALDHAHQQGVVHRDIKPANLMIDAKAKLYITDFGLAQMEENVGITMTGDIIGTLRYMSPEQALGKRVVVDHRADIYALGISLYELSITEPAFNGENRATLLKQIAFQEPRRLRQIERSIPRDLETIIHKAIAKNPDERYFSAQELADDLKAFRDNLPITAKPPSIVDRCSKWTFRNQGLVLAIAAVVLLTTIGLAISNSLIASQRNAANAARDGEKKHRDEAEKQAEIAKAINRFLTDYVMAKAEVGRDTADSGNSFRDVLDNASLYADRQFPDDPLLKGSLYQTIAQLYGRLGQFDQSETQYRKSIEMLKTSKDGDNSPILLGAINDLGHTLTLLGKTEEAEQLLRRNLQTGTDRLGNEHPIVLSAMLHLSEVLAAQKQFDEAHQLAQQCYTIRARVLGQDHPETALSSVGLSRVLSATGQSGAAKQLLLQATKILRDQRCIEDLNTQRALQDLAKLYVDEHDLSTAESLLQEILQTRIRVQGDDHSLTMAAMDDVSSLLEAQGRLAEAESLLMALGQTRSRRFGYGPDTLKTISRCAAILWKQGKITQSESLIKRSIFDFKDDATSTRLDLIVHYADVLLALGKHVQAEQLMRESFELTRTTLGKTHPQTAACLNRWIFSLQEQRKVIEAFTVGGENLGTLLPNYDVANGGPEEMAMVFVLNRQPYTDTVVMLKDSLRHKRETLPKMHLSIATTLSVLAQNQMVNQEFEEAKEFLEECLVIRQQGLPNDNWLLAETKSLLGECLVNLGQFEKAQPLLDESYRTIVDSKDLEACHKVEFARRLVSLYKQWGKLAQNQRWHQDLVTFLSECLNQRNSNVLSSDIFFMAWQEQLGESLCALERYQEAEALLLPAAAIQGIHGWYDNPFSGQTIPDRYRETIVGMYDAWNKPDEANRWRTLFPAVANCGEADLVEWYQQRIILWEGVCNGNPNPIYKVRLAKANSDLALLFLRYKHWEDALTWFEKSANVLGRISPDDAAHDLTALSLASTQLWMSDALAALNRHAEALHCLELAVEIAASLTDASVRSGGALASQVRQAPAKLAMFLANCTNAEFRDPKRSLQIAKHSKDLKGDMLVAMGVAYYRLDDFPSTIDVLGGNRHFILAMAHYKMGDERTSRFHYRSEIDHYQAHRVSIKKSNSLGKWWLFDQVEQFCDEATQLMGINPDERESLVAESRGHAFLDGNLKLSAEALESFRDAIHFKPENCEPYLGVAKAILANGGGDIQEAVGSMKKYFELNPENGTADAYATLGQVEGLNGEFDAAFEAVEKALQLEPDFAQAYWDLGQVLIREGLHDKASMAFSKALQIKPNEPNFLNEFAWFLANCEEVRCRDAARAVDLANNLTKLAPNDGNAWNTLGVAQFRLGNFQISVTSLNKAIYLNHKASGGDCIFLAMAYWQLGDHDRARDFYIQADKWMQQHEPNDQDLQRFRDEALELLGKDAIEEANPDKL